MEEVAVIVLLQEVQEQVQEAPVRLMTEVPAHLQGLHPVEVEVVEAQVVLLHNPVQQVE
jgi:hypothetical protein